MPYLFILYLDYILQTSIDLIKENGYALTKARSKRYPADYTDHLRLLINTLAQAESLLHSLEQAVGNMGLCVKANKI